MKVREIAEIIGISVDKVYNILQKIANEKSVCTISAAIADHRPITQSKKYFAAVFVDTQAQSA